MSQFFEFFGHLAKVLEFQLQHQSFQRIFRTDFLWDGLVGCPCKGTLKSLLQHHSSKAPILRHSALFTVQIFATTWTAARQASLSIINSQGLLKLMSIELVMPSNHLILCHPLLLLPSIFPSIKVFCNESVLHIRWPKYWSFSISPSSEY